MKSALNERRSGHDTDIRLYRLKWRDWSAHAADSVHCACKVETEAAWDMFGYAPSVGDL